MTTPTPTNIVQDRLGGYLKQFGQPDAHGYVEYHAFCPVHDRAPTERGRALPPPDRPLRVHVDHAGNVDRLECDHGCSQRDVLAKIGLTLNDLMADRFDDQRPAIVTRSRTSRTSGAAHAEQPPRFGYEPVLKLLSDVKPEPVRWLWPQRVPLGKLTVIAGDPGLGKTFLTHDMAARVSAGLDWPATDQGASHDRHPGDVVLLSAEDGLADTIYPRLQAAQADLTRIRALTAVRGVDGFESPFSLGRDLASLDSALDMCQRPLLVVIDPISAYLSRTDSHNNAEVRALLAPLAQLAERRGVAVVAVNHLNKAGGGKAIYRSMGSLAFIAAARAGWLIAKCAIDPDRRLMVSNKMNLVKEPTGLSFRIIDGRVAWDDEPVTMTADQALNAGSSGDEEHGHGHGDGHDHGMQQRAPRLAEAARFLTEELGQGEVAANDLEQAAVAQGIAVKTLRRARAALGLNVRRIGFGPSGRFMWSLPRASAQPQSQPPRAPDQPMLLDPGAPAPLAPATIH
jgi:hypothetical protein